MHTGPSPAYGAIGFRERSKCGQLSMGSSCGTHLIFPIPCFSALGRGEAGSYRLPARNKGKPNFCLTLLVSIEFRGVSFRVKRKIYSLRDPVPGARSGPRIGPETTTELAAVTGEDERRLVKHAAIIGCCWRRVIWRGGCSRRWCGGLSCCPCQRGSVTRWSERISVTRETESVAVFGVLRRGQNGLCAARGCAGHCKPD
jgi:hypothetical protein